MTQWPNPMSWAAAVQSAIEFARELYRGWKASAPQREQEERDAIYEEDLRATDRAIAGKDTNALASQFERERRAVERLVERNGRRGRVIRVQPGPADPT